MSKKFAEHSQLNLSQVNKDVLKKWDENDVFAKSMTEREGCPSFVFYEGPPSANGMPGIHHVMARTIKDTFCRYKTMKGFQVKRKAGWDTHGLPVELGVEKALHITKEDIGKTISVAEYNAACRKDVMKFTKEWTDLTHKMRCVEYLSGREVEARTAADGWCCVTVDGWPLGGGKVSGGRVKNHYPKALRLL